MKTFTKVILGVVGACLVLGIGLSIIGFSMGARNEFKSGNNGTTELLVSETDMQPFTSIDIDTTFGGVEFVESDTYGLEIYSSFNEDNVDFTNKNGNLTVTIKDKKYFGIFSWDFSIFDGKTLDDKIIVYMPKELDLDDVIIKCNAGTVDIADFNANLLDIDNDFGKIEMANIDADTIVIVMNSGKYTGTNIKAKKCDYDNDFGDTELNDFEAEKMTFKANSGKVEGEGCKFGTLNGECDFGKIEFTGTIADDLFFKNNSGETTFEGVFNTADIESDFGDVNIVTSKDKSEYDIDISVDFGKVEVDGEKRGTNYMNDNDGKPLLKIQADSGDVNVEFAD